MKLHQTLLSLFSTLLIVTGLLFSNTIAADSGYSVTGVKQWDVLSMRKYPGVNSKVIAQIPPDGAGISTTGKQTIKGKSTWVQVKWKTQTGWVNNRYLTRSSTGTSASDNNAHTHPKNKCTNSITHTHPSGSKSHIHRYSCMASDNDNASDANSHQHPANRCTRSVTHSHPNGKGTHEHRYSCQQKEATNTGNAHTHPKKDCTNSITHDHPNGKNEHSHRYSCE